jgi:hypothetical protein
MLGVRFRTLLALRGQNEGQLPARGPARLEAKETKGAAMASYEGYCVKCREKRSFDGNVKELKNGSKAAQGACPVCGTKMTRMLPKSA